MIRVKDEFFNIKDTLECGQIFRYKSINDGFFVISGDKACFARQRDGWVEIEGDEEYFSRFFDLETDYGAVCRRALNDSNQTVRFAAEYGKGIRILRQDREETVFSFLISQNNMIPRIKRIIERISAVLGEKKVFNGVEFYSFPKAYVLAAKDEEFFASLGCGYRAGYIASVARDIESGAFALQKLNEEKTDDLKAKLISLRGVGPKVADCVALFGYHRTDSFPVDTWVEKIYREDFDGTLRDRKKIASFFVERFGEDSGYVQQYLFHYKRNFNGERKK